MSFKLTRLYGRTGGKAGKGRVAQEDPDSLQSKAYAHMVDLLGEGPYEGFCNKIGVTIYDAFLLFQPAVVNGALVFGNNFKQELDGVYTGQYINSEQTVVTPLINQDSQGYPFNVQRPIKATIYSFDKPAVTEAAEFHVIVYPRTAQEKTDYLGLPIHAGTITADPAAWAVFADSLRIYPEGKVRGIRVVKAGAGYEAGEFRVILPRATLEAVQFDGVSALDSVDLTPRFQDIGLQYRLGYGDQTVMPGFDNVSTIITPNVTEEIKYTDTFGAGNTPWFWESDTEVDYDRLIIDINFPRGLYFQDMVLGDVKAIETFPVSFSMTHDVGVSDAAGDVAWRPAGPLGRGQYDIRGKTMSGYEKSIEVKLNKPGGDDTKKYYWRVNIIRLTKDDEALRVENGNDKNYITAFRVARITAVTDQQFLYPHCVLVGIRINAEQFNRLPVRSYRMKMLRVLVPDNYFPPFSIKVVRDAQGNELSRSIRQYAEYCRNAENGEGVYDANGNPIEQEWTGRFYTSWTNNPAWISFNACINTLWGMGKVLPPPNKWHHYRIGRYNDEYGNFNGLNNPPEPRFTGTVYFQTTEESYMVLRDLASIFAGYYYFSSGTMVPVQDAPRKPRMSFAPANVVNGTFTYQGTQRKARHTVAIVSHSDPNAAFKQIPAVYEDPVGLARYGYQTLELTAFGSTSMGQARRLGKRAIRMELSNTDTISFNTGLRGSILRPNDLVEIYDPTRSSLPFGGRIIDIKIKSVADGGDGLPWIISDRPISDDALMRAAQISNVNDLRPAEFAVVFTRSVGELSEFDIETADDIDKLVAKQITEPILLLDFQTDTKGRRMFRLREPLPADVKVGSIWGLRHANVHPQTFSVLGVEEVKPTEFAITAVEHHPAIYGEIFDDDVFTEVPINPDLDYWKRPSAPRNLRLEIVTKRDQGSVSYTLVASWSRPEFGWAKEYEVHLKKNLGNFQHSINTKDTLAEMFINEPDSYTVRVYALGITGILSEPAEANIGYLTGENNELVSGLEIFGQGNDHNFYYGELKIDWRVNWSQANSTLQTTTPPVMPGSVDAYILKLFDPAGVLLSEYERNSTDFTLTLTDNASLLNGPHRDMIVEVRARTNDFKLSVPARIRVVNSLPAVVLFTDISVRTDQLGNFTIVVLRAAQLDSNGYRVFASLTQGFVAAAENLIWEGRSQFLAGLSVTGATNPDTIYFRIAEFDLLSKDVLDCNISDEFSVVVENTVPDPAGLSVFDFL